MRIIYLFIVVLLCSTMLAGCKNNEPEGIYSKLVYSIILPKERGKIDKWSEVHLSMGGLVRADKAAFWIDADSRMFVLNAEGVRIADPKSDVGHATPELIRSINRNLVAAGKRSIHALGRWKHFQWNKRQ